MEIDSKVEDLHSNFLINYLFLCKKKTVKITGLTLKLNCFTEDISDFMEKQWAVRHGYIEIVKQHKKFVKLRLTSSAYLMEDTFKYDRFICKRNYILRILASIFILYRQVKKFIVEGIPYFIKNTFLPLIFPELSNQIWVITRTVLCLIIAYTLWAIYETQITYYFRLFTSF